LKRSVLDIELLVKPAEAQVEFPGEF